LLQQDVWAFLDLQGGQTASNEGKEIQRQESAGVTDEFFKVRQFCV
jgi:hypothetical protein